MEVSGQLHAPAALPPVPTGYVAGGPQSPPGRCGKEKSLALQGIEPGPSSPSLSWLLLQSTSNQYLNIHFLCVCVLYPCLQLALHTNPPRNIFSIHGFDPLIINIEVGIGNTFISPVRPPNVHLILLFLLPNLWRASLLAPSNLHYFDFVL
jgi:hypothetical protein